MMLHQSSLIQSCCRWDRGWQVLVLLSFTCSPPDLAFSASYSMIEHKRCFSIDRYKVLLGIFVLVCDEAALSTDMRPRDIFTGDNFIPTGMFDAFGDI